MSLNRYNARRDGNEKAIKKALKDAGVLFRPVNVAGLGDLIVQYRGQTFLLEIKMPKGSFTEAQIKARKEGWVIALGHTPEEAMRGVGVPEDIITRVLLHLIVPKQLDLLNVHKER